MRETTHQYRKKSILKVGIITLIVLGIGGGSILLLRYLFVGRRLPLDQYATYIHGDDELSSFCEIGDGSIENPFVIEDLVFGNDTKVGMCIFSTTKYLIIRNCTITDQNADGIFLYQSKNILVTNCTSNKNMYGIHLRYSEYITVENNHMSDNTCGIYLYGSIYCTLSNNTCDQSHTGICSTEQFFNSYIRNNCSQNYFGIDIGGGSNHIYGNFLSNNSYYGLDVRGSHNNTIWNNFFIQNQNSHAEGSCNASKWDNGTVGNYWDDYSLKYPNATINVDGITWSMPYLVENSTEVTYDFYPLVNPILYPD